MALIRGCHRIGKGNQSIAPNIAHSILKNGLLVNYSFYGVAAWAFYIDMVPGDLRYSPFVVFDVEEKFVERFSCARPDKPDYAIMKMLGTPLSYIPINVAGFVNLPGFQRYQGPVGFF